jgi:hypothetical protein
MTLEQLEERLTAVEQAVEELRQSLPPSNGTTGNDRTESEFLREEDIIPGVDFDVFLDVPPRQTLTFKAKLISIERENSGLGLSDREWESIPLEDEHER